MQADSQTIVLRAQASPKPRPGDPCNGCGVCCALDLCPAARLLFRRVRGPCPALLWQPAEVRYLCGLVKDPAAHLSWLPRRWQGAGGRFFARAVAAGRGCDCDAEVLPDRLI